MDWFADRSDDYFVSLRPWVLLYGQFRRARKAQ